MRQSISLLTHFCAKGNAAPENGVTCKGFQELSSRKGSENGISGDSCGNEKMRREYNKAFWHVFHGIDGTGGSGLRTGAEREGQTAARGTTSFRSGASGQKDAGGFGNRK